MDTAFKKDMYMNYAMLWSGSIGGEASTELVVPDSMPDIGVIVDAEAVLSIRSKEAEAGRIRATAELNIRVLYQPEDGSALRSLPLSMSCDVSANVADADLNCQAVIQLRVRTLDAKAINSRKLGLRAELSGSACCLRREELELVQSLSIPGVRLQTLPQTTLACMISDVREKTFVITDDYNLPGSSMEPSSILLQRILLQSDGYEFVNGKLVFRGKARVFLLLACGADLHPCHFETPFSQIIEIGGQAELLPEISLMLTGAFFDLPEHSGGSITAELHILAQVIAREERELNYMADLYSNQQMLTPVMAYTPLCAAMRSLPQSRSLSGSVELPPDAASVLYAKGILNNVSTENNNIIVSLTVKAIYRRNDNRHACVNVRLKENFETALSQEESLVISSVSTGDSFASISSGSLEVRLPVELQAYANTETTISHVIDVQNTEESLPERPSVILTHVAAGDNLWELAKNHCSTCEAILQANNGREEGLLLIPKVR